MACIGNKTALQERLLKALQDEEEQSATAAQQPDSSSEPLFAPTAPMQALDDSVSVDDHIQSDKQHQQQQQLSQQPPLADLTASAPDEPDDLGPTPLADPPAGQVRVDTLQGNKKPGWAGLTADRLRNQLRIRGLPTNGLKTALVARIIEAAGPQVIEITESEGLTDASVEGASDADTLKASTSAVTDLSSYR